MPAMSDRHLETHTETLRRAVVVMRSLQRDDGHWCGELQGDSILQSEYILMKFILGQDDAPMIDGSDGPATLARIGNELRLQQRDDGSWGQYPGAGIDLSATVKGYFVLKLLGDDPGAPHMTAARHRIHEEGGAERCASFTNFFLACLGQISFDAVPEIPPEIVFLPKWFYFNLANVSAWTRTMIMPLSLVTTLRPLRELPADMGIDELFLDDRERHRLTVDRADSGIWKTVFLSIDRALKTARVVGRTPLRKAAIRRAEQWVLDRAGQEGEACTDGLGAIFPPMVYIQIAMMALGYPREHEVVQRAERELDALFLDRGEAIRIQPCFSPVWDTGIAAYALTDCGFAEDDPSLSAAAAWLRSKECRHVGDWAGRVKGAPQIGGWWFEYNNAWYPDIDDTAMVAMALRRAGGEANIAAAQRGVDWLMALQNDDGGWAAFDKTRDRRLLEYVPFADHNAMQDPSCPDITGRVLECLSWHDYTIDDTSVARAIEYIHGAQDPDGCWFGRWGVNYIYGTWQSVVGPIRCGLDREVPWVLHAGDWITSKQNQDGSFGESCDSYFDPSTKGRGPATASQTAWAAMILQELYGHEDERLRRAIEWLARTQLTEEDAADPDKNPDDDPAGSWHESWFTGTGFPRVFYLRYHLYRHYFPLMAIGRYLDAHGRTLDGATPTHARDAVERATV